MYTLTSPERVGTQRTDMPLKTSPILDPSDKIRSRLLEFLTTWRSLVILVVLFLAGSLGDREDIIMNGGIIPAKLWCCTTLARTEMLQNEGSINTIEDLSMNFVIFFK